jgi:hypothetical protein
MNREQIESTIREALQPLKCGFQGTPHGEKTWDFG